MDLRAILIAVALAAAAPPQDPPPAPPPPADEEEEEGEGEGEDEGPDAPRTPPGVVKPAAPAAPVLRRAAVPGSTAAVTVSLRDFRPDAEEAEQDPDRPRLLFGHLGEGRTTLSLVAAREKAPRASAAVRDAAAEKFDPPVEKFLLDGIACAVASAVYPEAPGAKQVHLHAYPVAAGWAFDLHLSVVSFDGKVDAPRPLFEEIVRSLRFGWFRRGAPELHPAPLLEAMDRAVRAAPEEVRHLEGEVKARPGDGHLHLVLAEALLAADRAESAAAAGERAAALLAEGDGAGAAKEARFALWLARDGAAEAWLRAGKSDRAKALLAKARPLADALGLPSLRAATIYGLARCAGEKGEGKAAAALLAEAIALEGALREAARADGSFRRVRVAKEMKALLGE